MATVKISIKSNLDGLYYATWIIQGDSCSVHNTGTSFYKEKIKAIQEAKTQARRCWKNSFEGRKSSEDLEFSIEDNSVNSKLPEA